METAVYLLRNNYNRFFYDSVLLRNLNFRKSDKSSILNHPRYINFKNRLKTNDKNVYKVFKNKVINHFLTHFVSNCSEPILKAFKNKLLFIRMFRSPLNVSMIKHLAKWSIKWENMKSRDGILKNMIIDIKKLSFFVNSNLKDYLAANIYERVVIFRIDHLKKINLERFGKKYGSRVITIPFENLIVNPNYYMKQISNIRV